MIFHQSNTNDYLIANRIGASAGEKLAGIKQALSAKPLNKGQKIRTLNEYLNATKDLYNSKDAGFSPLTSSDVDVQSVKSGDNPETSSASSLKSKASVSTEAIGAIKADDPLLKQKNEVIDRLIAPGMSEENKQKVRDAFKHSSIAQLQKVADYGVEIYADPKVPENWAGSYNALTNKVKMSPSEFEDPEKIKHSLNHEVLGHGYFAAKFGDNTPKALQTVKRLSHSFISRGFNVDPNKDINDVREIYHDFRDRVRTDKAVKIKNLNEGLDKIQGNEISDSDFRKLMEENKINFNFGGTFQKESARDLSYTLLGVKDVKINKNQDGTAEISFKEIPNKEVDKDLLMKKLPFPLLAAGIASPLTGGLSAVGAGLAVFGAEKLTSSAFSTETRAGEREVSCGDYTAKMKQNKDQFTVTLPKNSQVTDSLWSKYAFNARELEEYMAEGQALMNKSPESREHLKSVDPKLYNYLLERM